MRFGKHARRATFRCMRWAASHQSASLNWATARLQASRRSVRSSEPPQQAKPPAHSSKRCPNICFEECILRAEIGRGEGSSSPVLFFVIPSEAAESRDLREAI